MTRAFGRTLGILFLLGVSAGCAHRRLTEVPGAPLAEATRAWLEEDAPRRALSQLRGTGEGAASTIEAAWLEALIAAERRSAAALFEAAERLTRDAPDRAETRLALRLALSEPALRPELPALADRLLEAARDPLAVADGVRLRLELAGLEPEARRALVARGRFATNVRITGPFPLARTAPPPGPGPLGAVTRRIREPTAELPLRSDETPGLYVVEAEVPEGVEAALVWTPGRTEVLIDERRIRSLGGLRPARIPVEDGQRIALRIWASGPGPAALAFTDRSERRVPALRLPPLAAAFAKARAALVVGGESGSIAARDALEPLRDRTDLARGAPLHLLWAQVMNARGHPEAGIRIALERALAADPTHPGVRLALARLDVGARPTRALELLDGLPEDTAPAASLALRLEALDTLDRTAEALDVTRRVEILPTAPPALDEAAARFLRRLEHLDRARRLEDRADRGRPARVARRARERGRLGVALERWSEIAASGPLRARPRAHAEAAELALAIGELDRSRVHADRALELDPRRIDVLRTRLRIAIASSDLAEADRALARLARVGGAELEDHLGLLALSGHRGDPLEIRFPSQRGTARAEWSGASSVILLDRVVDRIQTDGRVLSTRHLVRRIQSEEAAEVHEEPPLGSASAVVLDLATEAPPGERRPAERIQAGEGWTFSSVDPGDDLVARWMLMEPAASALGGYLRTFDFGADVPTARAEWIVRVPAGHPWRAESFHGAPAPEVYPEADGATVIRFFRRRIEAVPAEPLTPAPEAFLPFAAVWVDFGEDRLRRAQDVEAGLPAFAAAPIASVVRRLTAGISDPGMVADRLVAWVLDEVEDGPERAPDVVLDTRSGDRDALFVALAQASGLDAELALAHPGGAPGAHLRFPSPARYPLRGVRLVRPEGPTWVRLGGPAPMVGPLPRAFRGGLWRPVGGRARALRPEEVGGPPTDVTVEAEVDARGRARGRLVVTLHGDDAALVRARWRSTPPGDRAELAATWLTALLPGAERERIRLGGTVHPWSPLVIELGFSHPSLFDRRGRRLESSPLLESPLAERALGVPTLPELAGSPARTTPLELPALEARTEWWIAFPDGARTIAAPPDLTLAGPFGHVSQRFDAEDGARRVVRVRSSPGGVVDPALAEAIGASLREAALGLTAPLAVQLPEPGASRAR